MSTPKPSAKELDERRIRLLLESAGWEKDAESRKARIMEIASYGEEVLPVVLDALRLQSASRVAREAIIEIEKGYPGSFAKHAETFHELIETNKNLPWLLADAAKLTPTLQTSAAAGHDSNAAKKGLKAITMLANSLPSPGAPNTIRALLKRLTSAEQKAERQRAEQELLGMGEAAAIPLLELLKTAASYNQADNVRVAYKETWLCSSALYFLSLLENDNPGLIDSYGGLPAVLRNLELDSETDPRWGIPASDHILLTAGLPAVKHLLMCDKDAARCETVFRQLVEKNPAGTAEETVFVSAEAMNAADPSKFLDLLKNEKTTLHFIEAALETATPAQKLHLTYGISKMRSKKAAKLLASELSKVAEGTQKPPANLVNNIVHGLLCNNSTEPFEKALESKKIRKEALKSAISYTLSARDSATRRKVVNSILAHPGDSIGLLFGWARAGNATQRKKATAFLLEFEKYNLISNLKLKSKIVADQEMSLAVLGKLLKDSGGFAGLAKGMEEQQRNNFRSALIFDAYNSESDEISRKTESLILKNDGAGLLLPSLSVTYLGMKSDKPLSDATKLILAIVEKEPVAPQINEMIGNLAAVIQGAHPVDERVTEAEKVLCAMGVRALPILIEAQERTLARKKAPIETEKYYERTARLLAEVAVKNNLGECPEMLAILPTHVERVASAKTPKIENGSAEILFAIGKPAIKPLAERYHKEKSPGNAFTLTVLAHLGALYPGEPEIKKLLPVFATTYICSLAAPKFDDDEIKRGRNLIAGKIRLDSELNFCKVCKGDKLVLALAAAGNEGVELLCKEADGADTNKKFHALKALCSIRQLRPDMADEIKAKLAPHIELTILILADPGEKKQARANLLEMGLVAVEPIVRCVQFVPELQDNHRADCLGILREIAKGHPNSPGLAPMIPVFIALEDEATLTQIGTPAISFILKEFKKHPEKAKWCGNVLTLIASLAVSVDTGVVSESVKPKDMQREMQDTFARHGFDVKWKGGEAKVKPIKVKA